MRQHFRGKRLGLSFSIVALLSAADAGALPLPALHLVDDRGQPIDRPVEICFRVELRTDCRRVAAGEDVRPPAGFHGLRIEGEDHGPADLRRESLEVQADGSFRVAVPRKALLHIETRGRQEPLTLSLYSPHDETFREPAFRVRLSPGESAAKVPSGTHIASLAMARNAPDLQRLTAEPAGRHRLVYRPRPGWSLVARCRAAASRPVVDAQLRVAEVAGYGQPERQLAEAASGTDGLVLLSGIEVDMVSLEARHPGFFPAEARGLTASPGTFAFREINLGIGGRIAAHVTANGRPLAEATCQVLTLEAEAPDPRNPYRLLGEVRADAQGTCVSSRLAQGEYKLRIRIADGKAQVNRWIDVTEGQDTEVDVPLASTRVFGEVRRGGKPAPGYTVEAMFIDMTRPGSRGDISDDAESDEAGHYELTLWDPGWYSLRPRSASKVPAAGHQELTTAGNEERRVDFALADTAVRGTVVDEEQLPVEKARVALQWEGVVMAETDAAGRFEIDVQGEGAGTLHAGKPGYRESSPVEVRVEKDTPLSPVTLVLKRKDTAHGKVVAASGSPVPGAWIGSSGFTIEGPFLFSTARADAQGAFEIEIPPGPSRLFFSGPACPLSWFDRPAAAEGSSESALPCPDRPAALELTLLDDQGGPVPNTGVILRRDGAIVPSGILTNHLHLLGLSSRTDGTGRLFLAGLSPGEYDLFLSSRSSEGTIAGGQAQGYLTTVSLAGLQTTALQVTLPQGQ